MARVTGTLSDSPKRRRAPQAYTPRLGSIAAAAEFLDVHPRTVRRMIHVGHLRCYRVARLLKVDMNEVHALAQPVPPESVSA
ncbi:excisionase family DNA-binding protein [Phytoactinopolyspora limicola]|uniref:excisionase family DNA-binding protein n=1 Tax=Phytoactinopolyspora limicola TaxID=2715536 RepID=UPI00140D9877